MDNLGLVVIQKVLEWKVIRFVASGSEVLQDLGASHMLKARDGHGYMNVHSKAFHWNWYKGCIQKNCYELHVWNRIELEPGEAAKYRDWTAWDPEMLFFIGRFFSSLILFEVGFFPI